MKAMLIPFITRHAFGLPRTRANQNKVRLKLRNLAHWLACILGAGFLAVCGWILATLALAI